VYSLVSSGNKVDIVGSPESQKFSRIEFEAVAGSRHQHSFQHVQPAVVRVFGLQGDAVANLKSLGVK
jgi:hypothetical protein